LEILEKMTIIFYITTLSVAQTIYRRTTSVSIASFSPDSNHTPLEYKSGLLVLDSYALICATHCETDRGPIRRKTNAVVYVQKGWQPLE
jgi:hypothetical protein